MPLRNKFYPLLHPTAPKTPQPGSLGNPAATRAPDTIARRLKPKPLFALHPSPAAADSSCLFVHLPAPPMKPIPLLLALLLAP
ncbi:MAG: hypothetical protein ABJF10_01960, partial [Chthoniobacter sp.]